MDKCIPVLFVIEKRKNPQLTHSGKAQGEINTLPGRDPSRAHTPAYVCGCVHQGMFYKNIDTHAHTSCHTNVCTTQAFFDKKANAQVAQSWHCGFFVALSKTAGKKKLSSQIRGITIKSTTARRIAKTEQDGLKSDKSDRQTDRQ